MPYADLEKQRQYQREWARKHRERRKDALNAARKKSQRKNREWLRKRKEASPCTDCGSFFPHYIMEWDHLPGHDKHRNVSSMCNMGRDKIEQEMAKCELVCANCHRVRTHERRSKCASQRRVARRATSR